MGINKKYIDTKNESAEEAQDSDSSDSDSDVSMSESNEDSSENEEDNTTMEASDLQQVDEPNDEEEDEVIKAIREASTKKRDHPPVIECDSFVVDISFHPGDNLLAVANIDGDVLLYKYTNEENTLLQTIELHEKACRAIDFNTDGDTLFSTSKDRSIMLTDVETCKLKRFYDNSHDVAVYTISTLNENLFATGDDNGTVKLWDLRINDDKSVFSLKKNEDYISDIVTHSDEKYLFCSSGDGSITTIDLRGRYIHIYSKINNVFNKISIFPENSSCKRKNMKKN